MTEHTDPGRFGHGPVWWRGRRGLRRVWPGDGLGAAAGSRGREPPRRPARAVRQRPPAGDPAPL